jgi:small subunit ribosomal protein S14
MAKKGMIAREEKRKKLVYKHFVQRVTLAEKRRTVVSLQERFQLGMELQKFPRNSCPTRLHNRCFITGRPKGYYRYFGLSRHFLRSMAHEGLLPGVVKSSW